MKEILGMSALDKLWQDLEISNPDNSFFNSFEETFGMKEHHCIRFNLNTLSFPMEITYVNC